MKTTWIISSILLVTGLFAQDQQSALGRVNNVHELRKALVDAQRNDQKVFVEEFTGIN